MYQFKVIAPGVDTETIERAEAAAQAVFDAARVTPWEAASYWHKWFTAQMVASLSEPDPENVMSAREREAADAWDDSITAAAKVCYGGDGRQTPKGFDLVTPRYRED